jgi:hypothetical protein
MEVAAFLCWLGRSKDWLKFKNPDASAHPQLFDPR